MGHRGIAIDSIQFKRSHRARHLNIRIRPYKGVEVTVPKGMSMAAAERLVLQKRDWIERTLRKVKQFEADSVIYDGRQDISTRRHRLVVQPGDIENITCRIDHDTVLVRYPQNLELTAPEVQAAIRKGLVEAYRKEAKAYLPSRVAALAQRWGYKYGKVFIKNHRARWGSCSKKNNINLSLHLMRLPDHLIDYVILHELVHTIVKNHSRGFWKSLAQVCPQVESLRKEMRRRERELKPLS